MSTELTLTGASLLPPSSSTAAATAAVEGGVGSEASQSHSHGHSHGHGGDACCNDHPPSNRGLPRPTIPLEQIVSDPTLRFRALTSAVKLGPFESFETLANAIVEKCGNAELGRFGEDGHTLAHWCAKRGDDTRFLEYLASHSVDSEGGGSDGSGKKRIVIDLRAASHDDVGMRPLHWAATEGSIPAAALLLRHLNDRPAATNKTRGNETGDTAGGAATKGGAGGDSSSHGKDSADATNNAGATVTDGPNPIDDRDKSGCTPLLVASQYGHADLVAFLLQRGANADAVDSSRDTALHWAAYKGSVEVCGLLLHLNGIEGHLDVPDAFGQTPLHLASLRGNAEVVQYLVEEAEGLLLVGEGQRRRQMMRGGEGDDATSSPSSSGVGRVGSRGAGTPSSVARQAKFPAKLLSLPDRDGKTPLDLAIKKKKAGCEALLREYEDRHCAPPPSIWTQIQRTLRDLVSIRSWKMWMGAVSDMPGQPPKFPFYLVLATIALAFFVYPMTFLPVGRSADGLLWDHMGLHAFTLTCMAAIWIFLYLTWRTNPGVLNAAGTWPRASSSSGGVGDGTGGGGAELMYCWGGDANDGISAEMERVTGNLRRRYEDVLESYSREASSSSASSSSSAEKEPLCHSCHIAKPLRSKHCRVLKRCVLLFDHHCPFVGATIGLYNYRYFYLFLLSVVLGEVGFLITWIIYLLRSPRFPLGIFFIGLYLLIFFIMVSSLFVYHTQLILSNMTTNEHQNLFRYTYLRDEAGRYRNPFDQGRIRNLMQRLSPGEDSYVAQRMAPRSPLGGRSESAGSDGRASTGGDVIVGKRDGDPRREEEKKDLLQHLV